MIVEWIVAMFLVGNPTQPPRLVSPATSLEDCDEQVKQIKKDFFQEIQSNGAVLRCLQTVVPPSEKI